MIGALVLGVASPAPSGAPIHARGATPPSDSPGPVLAGSLGADDWRQLERGNSVLRTRPVAEFPWPEITVYRRVGARPAEIMAVYVDFESQATYMPEIVASRIVKRDAPNVFHVFYEYVVTGPNEKYTVEVAIGRMAAGFRASWNLLAARYARRLSGELRVEPLGSGSLLAYTSRVDPGALGVAFGTPDTVARRLRATAEALATRVERLVTSDPARVETLVRALDAMLGADMTPRTPSGARASNQGRRP